jgi:hypothetical protein
MMVSAGGVMGALRGVVFRVGAVHRHSAYDSERCDYFVLLWLLFEDVRGAVNAVHEIHERCY